ncbi:MAG: tRNA uridine-5-carboxymethylaminomethyl(34) synthesis GTPase MnmE [Thermodesulfobacteriota bacterium]
MYRHGDTIAAIATPVGAGGIGIIKISGPRAEDIVRNIFRPCKPIAHLQSHHLYYGHIVDPANGEVIDEVLLAVMRRPHTYTREDVAEINCHSGYIILQRILSVVLACGARLAEPGEFTKRAFLNGRIDLTQAEAVMESIAARTRHGLKLATGQLMGGLAEQVNIIKNGLLDALAVLEVAIDFPEEDVEIVEAEKLASRLEGEVVKPIQALLASYEQGRVYREGVTVAIMGRPNVGKSSLLNTLLEEERAIVTAIPGTTRDIIEELLNVQGIPVKIIDTAGLREARDEIEGIGIKLTRKRIAGADLLLFVIDGSAELSPEDYEIYNSIREKSFIIVVNKMDLGVRLDPDYIRNSFTSGDLVVISALRGTNLDKLKEAIFAAVVGGATDMPDTAIVPNARQYAALTLTLPFIYQARENLLKGVTPDIVAIDIQEALQCLGEITGQTTPEDVLDRIFSQFCIGK